MSQLVGEFNRFLRLGISWNDLHQNLSSSSALIGIVRSAHC
jgi:hypothetical protein